MCNACLLGETIDDIPTFPRLHSLALTTNLETMARNLAILCKFPSIQTLDIRGWGTPDMSGLDVPVAGLLPRLKQYTGMIQTLHIFLPLPTLARLKTYYGNPHLFVAQLDQLPAPSTITALDVCFDEFDNRTLEKLSAFFARLVELRIRILHGLELDDLPDDINPQATSFFNSLSEAPALPPTLKHLALTWEFEYGAFDDAPPCGALPDLGSLRDALLARCPDLAFLWLDGHDFLLRWCKYPDGTVDEHTLADACEVEAMRPELYIL
ncbi:hypothetical protein FB451DRAFT_1394748 [Mycena latifolia]|nr:hypothetical protein FB451DRAFT_1394748 [Mycena latifolia]